MATTDVNVTVARVLRSAAVMLARSRAAPEIVFHGTASGRGDRVLRSILKRGLVPSAKDKVWAEDPHTGVYSPSRVSYDGVYFARRERSGVAFNSMRRAVEMLGGVPLMVVARLQVRSALPDEDSFHNAVKYAVQSVLGDLSPKTASFYVTQARLGVPLKKEKTKFHESLASAFRDQGWPTKSNTLRVATDRLFDGAMLRLAAYAGNTFDPRRAWELYAADTGRFQTVIEEPSQTLLDYYKAKGQSPPLPEKMYRVDPMPPDLAMAPSREDGEAAYRTALDSFMKQVRRTALQHNTLRVLDPVDFKGRNRIVCVSTLPDYSEPQPVGGYKLIVHYGDPSAIIDEMAKQGYRAVVVNTDRLIPRAR